MKTDRVRDFGGGPCSALEHRRSTAQSANSRQTCDTVTQPCDWWRRARAQSMGDATSKLVAKHLVEHRWSRRVTSRHVASAQHAIVSSGRRRHYRSSLILLQGSGTPFSSPHHRSDVAAPSLAELACVRSVAGGTRGSNDVHVRSRAIASWNARESYMVTWRALASSASVASNAANAEISARAGGPLVFAEYKAAPCYVCVARSKFIKGVTSLMFAARKASRRSWDASIRA